MNRNIDTNIISVSMKDQQGNLYQEYVDFNLIYQAFQANSIEVSYIIICDMNTFETTLKDIYPSLIYSNFNIPIFCSNITIEIYCSI